MRIHNSPDFLGMNTAGAIQGLLLSSITPCFSMWSIYLSTSLRKCSGTRRGGTRIAEPLVGTLWKATEVDPGIERNNILYWSTTDVKVLLVETGNSYCSGAPKSGIAHSSVGSVAELAIAAIVPMCGIFLHVSSQIGSKQSGGECGIPLE